jgi:transposase
LGRPITVLSASPGWCVPPFPVESKDGHLMVRRVVEVTGGVDTHKDTHTAAALDGAGRVLGTEQFATTRAGFTALLAWLRGFGRIHKVGVEGTGAYGAGLTRFLRQAGVVVIEVDRPDRKTRRRQGKSDPIDAVCAARAVLAGTRTGTPKQSDSRVEALRNLRVARRSAVQDRADARRQMHTLVITAPDEVREQVRDLTVAALVKHCAAADPNLADIADPAVAVMVALRSLARRHQRLTAEITDLDKLITPLVGAINPKLMELNGVGPDVAGQLLVTAGANTDRLRGEAAFAMLCGASPLPASSGKTDRHRLNRGGDRQANAALYRVVLSRLRWDERTRVYTERRTKEGKSKKEIIRCLKRYIAREIYALLNPPQPASTPA